MNALVCCILAFGITYWAGKRSLGQGLVAVLAVGCFYGILRANMLVVFSHFIFDAGLLGLYCSSKWRSADPKEAKQSETIYLLTMALMIWPCLLVLLPFQTLLVSLVGLRGNVFFIPILLLGSRLKHEDLMTLSAGMAVLNLIALGFAVAEYFKGLPPFFPWSPVTNIMYNSADVAGGFFRIPATFTSAHAYGGTMVATLPYLLGGWSQATNRMHRLLTVLGVAAAMMGVLMSATRLNFALGTVVVLASFLTGKMKPSSRLIFVLLTCGIMVVALSNERFQRFKTLGDAESVADRVAGSVNRSFFEILLEYPMGNGLGGGGTSLPYFLQGQLRNPIGMENEYARILCEQGMVGLLLWICFIWWFFSRARIAFAKGPWFSSRRIVWCLAAFALATSLTGTGTFVSIPGSVLLLLGMGWTSSPMLAAAPRPVPLRSAYASRTRAGYKLTYTG
jgi:hypothetical protein